MKELEAKIAAREAELADPMLYRRDAARFKAATEALQAAQSSLVKAEERWLTLEAMREEIEG